MDQKDLNQSLNNLTTRLTVVEALQKERSMQSSKEHAAIMGELKQTRDTITNMRVKHATMSGAIALIASYLIHILTAK